MPIKKNLTFRHKAILTAAMLEELYNYPRDFVKLQYKDLSNGIVFGFDYFLDDDELILSAGAFKFDGEIFFMPENLNISDLAKRNNLILDRKYFLALTDGQPLWREPCLTEFQLSVSFLEENPAENFITLGNFRFRGPTRFYLPELAEDKNPFEDIFRESSFTLIDVPFAAKHEPTFHPLIFRLVKKFLQTKPQKTLYDFALLTALQNGNALSIETLANYIVEAGVKKSFGTRRELLQAFCNALLQTEYRPAQIIPSEQKKSPARFSRSPGKLL